VAICTVVIRFRLADAESIEEAQAALGELVDCVRVREPEMLTYVAYQENRDPLRFCQYMEFLDENAYERHATSAHLRHFVATVRPLCSEEPDCVRLTELRRAEPA
jgi:quinol monooxygenase YgiN